MKVGLVFGLSELASPEAFREDASGFIRWLEPDFDVVGGKMIQSNEEFRRLKEEINFNEVDALVLFPLTGGTEGFLKEFSVFRRPTVLYGNSFNNSLAAAIELREYFRDRLIPSTVVKTPEELKAALLAYEDVGDVLDRFLKARIGLIGRVSPWLINERLDIPYTHISLKKFYEYYDGTTAQEGWEAVKDVVKKAEEIREPDREALTKSGRVYVAIKRILEDYHLEGFTIGCFDLIGRIGTTPCLALAMFNAHGVPAACEGELNALLGMLIIRKFFDRPAFMGNLADFNENHVIIAHCTAPLVSKYFLRTHFESGTGVGVAVELPRGRATLFKIRGRHAVVTGVEVEGNEFSESRCRTQVRLKLNDAPEFVDGTLGNHHLLAYVDPEELSDLLSELGFEVILY